MAGHDYDQNPDPSSPLNPYDEETQERIERATELRENDPIAGRGDLVDVSQASIDAGYELKDVELRPLIRAGVALLLFTILSFFATTVILGFRSNEINVGMNGEIVPQPQGEVPVRIESRRVEGTEYQLLKRDQERSLTQYLIDENGTVTIPVERAMELLLEEGAFASPATESTDPLTESRARTLRYSANENYAGIVNELEQAAEEAASESHGGATDGEDGAE